MQYCTHNSFVMSVATELTIPAKFAKIDLLNTVFTCKKQTKILLFLLQHTHTFYGQFPDYCRAHIPGRIPGFSRTVAFSQDFSGLADFSLNVIDFQNFSRSTRTMRCGVIIIIIIIEFI